MEVVLLISGITTDLVQLNNQNNLEHKFRGHFLKYSLIDGALPDNKDIRDQLFGLSNMRGKYPQCFIKNSDESYTFIGLFEKIRKL
jgi:hypothetical protein